MGIHLVKIYLDTNKDSVDQVHNTLSAHFGLPKGRLKSYSEVIEYNDRYGFIISLEGKYNVSDLIDTGKVVDYVLPEPVEETEEEVIDG
jgi:hypothetical protein